ncbi:MAG TPA: nucleoside triphosphate pyrophosphohydrolase [Flavobacteriia bacterium]|nr:nucleoside triphosphate pyrophosphohydrolase [Flavobacteriia bacterium]
MHTKKQKLEAFSKLLVVMDELREQCPWDKKQTYESLRPLTIEETHELGEAILDGNEDEIKKELGDLLLHIVFYAKIGEENKSFDIADVSTEIVKKLIYRHPHIYGDAKVKNAEEVKQNWEKLKLKEGNKKKKSVLEGVPKSLPTLIKASRLQEKVAGVGFEWQNNEDFYKKIEEELQEFKTEIENNQPEKAEEEFGDLVFALINFARSKKINVDNALEKTNLKFIKRFQKLEELIQKENKNIASLNLEEMMKYYNLAKKIV